MRFGDTADEAADAEDRLLVRRGLDGREVSNAAVLMLCANILERTPRYPSNSFLFAAALTIASAKYRVDVMTLLMEPVQSRGVLPAACAPPPPPPPESPFYRTRS